MIWRLNVLVVLLPAPSLTSTVKVCVPAVEMLGTPSSRPPMLRLSPVGSVLPLATAHW